MTSTGLQNFDTTLRRTHGWLNDVGRALDDPDRRHAYRVLRAVLQALRDVLPVEECAHLGAQLPMLVRGFYFEGWRPGRERERVKTKDEFLALIRDRFGVQQPLDAQLSAAAVFKVLSKRLSEGEVEKLKHSVPKPVAALWPQPGEVAVFLGDDPHTDALRKPVAEFMTRGVLWTAPDAPLAKVLPRMNQERVRHALVVAPAGIQAPDSIPADAIVGILSNRDVLRRLEQSPNQAISLDRFAVHEVMTPAPLVSVGPEATLAEAAEQLRESRVSALPVIGDGLLKGIITTDDLLYAGSLASDPRSP